MAELTRLGQVLHEEHFRILVSICELQNRVSGKAGGKAFEPGNDDDTEEINGLISFLDGVLAHDAFEEDVVFPQIRADGNGLLADQLAEEHMAIEPATHRLRALAVEILRHGPGEGRWTEFRQVAESLFAQMLRHLEMEEELILQRLHHLLDTATDHRLALQHLAARPRYAVEDGTAAHS